MKYMQDFLHANHDDVVEAVKRFERMISKDKEVFFDVHQVENIFDFYLEKSLLKQAEQILQIGLRQHPQSTSLLVKKAGFLADSNQLDDALGILLKVAPIENTNPEVFITLGWVMLQKDEIHSAVRYFNRAVDLAFDDEEDILLEIAYNLNQSEVYIEAVKFLEILSNKYPNNTNALFEFAFALEKIGERQRSINIYERVLELDPFSENAWYNVGILYNKEDRFIEASQAYDFTIAINPYHTEAYFNKGNSLAHKGCFAEALEAYIYHVSLSRDVVLTYQYIADCWEQLGNFDMAIRFYKLVTKELPESGDAWYGIGTALMEKEDFKNGLQAIDQAISINPMNADYWFAHARGLFELDQADDATRSLENGLNIDPEELSGWIELLKLKMGLDKSFVLQEFLKELQEQYSDVAAIHYLSVIINYKYLNDNISAFSELKKALNTDSSLLSYLLDEIPEIQKIPEFKSILPNT
ncbi:tetratricopeptide repeat protein [Carboxylicivirga linearis]|nr:tetratricopeptide repeat protein [Carboxylicivirga linearis]